MLSLLIILCVIAVAMYLVYAYVAEPLKWIFLAILGIVLIIVVFRTAGISIPQ